MFSPAKEKGPNVLQMCGWNVSSFHEGIRESKDAIHTANTLFHNQWNTGGDSADKKRFKRSTWNESDLWVPGSQARKWGQLLVYMNKMATDGHWWGSKAVVCAFWKSQGYSDLAGMWGSTAFSLQLRNNNSLFHPPSLFYFSLYPFKHTAIFTLHLLAHGSTTVGPDLQPVFQTLLLARQEKGTSIFEHPLCRVLIWLQEMFGNVRLRKEAGSSIIYTN